MTDVFIEFDRQLGRKVFRPDRSKDESKMSLASNEGVIMKKLVGSLRALWRSSKNRGFDDKVTELKSYLLPSPCKDDDDSDGPSPRSPSGSDNEGEEGVDSDGEGEEMVEGWEEDEKEAGSGATVSDSDSCPEVVENQADDESDTPMSDEVSNHQPLADESSDSKLLRARTLELGEEPSESSDSEDSMHRCSQVSSGWMGRAIAAGNKMDRERKEKEAAEEAERSKKEKIDMLMDEIRKDLEKEMDCELKGTEMWVGYADWCRHAFNTYGDNVYDHLATVENYQSFVSHFKSQDIRACIFESSHERLVNLDHHLNLHVNRHLNQPG